MDVSLVLLVDLSLVGSSIHPAAYTRLRHSEIGHVVPEAILGGPIALVKDGDIILIDAETRTITWKVDEAEQEKRKKEWDAAGPHEFREKRGILYKYARDVAVSISHISLSWVLHLTYGIDRSPPTLGHIPIRMYQNPVSKSITILNVMPLIERSWSVLVMSESHTCNRYPLCIGGQIMLCD